MPAADRDGAADTGAPAVGRVGGVFVAKPAASAENPGMIHRIYQRLSCLALLLLPLGAVAAPTIPVLSNAGALPAAGAIAADVRPVKDEISLSEAVAQVKREYGGRILEAETRESDGRRVHVIKVLTREGRVRTVRIPAGRGER